MAEHPAHSGHEFGGGYARAQALAAGDPDWMNATGGTAAPEPAVHQFWRRKSDGAEFIIRSVVTLRQDRTIVTKQRTDRQMGRSGDYYERITLVEFLKRYTYERTAA